MNILQSKFNIVFFLLGILFLSYIILKKLTPFPFDTPFSFHLTLTIITVACLSMYGYTTDDELKKYKKIKAFLSTLAMTLFIYMGIIFLEFWQWNNDGQLPSHHGGNPKAGIFFLLIRLIRSVEVYWWGFLFLFIGTIFFFIAKKDISLLNNKYLAPDSEKIKPQNKHQKINQYGEKKESTNETIYRLYQERVATNNIHENDNFTNFTLQNAQIIGEYVVVNYLFDSIKQSKQIIDEALKNHDPMNSILAGAKWFEKENLNGLGHDLGKYFYELIKGNNLLQTALDSGLKIRYVITTQNLEKKLIIISDNIFTKDNFTSYSDVYK